MQNIGSTRKVSLLVFILLWFILYHLGFIFVYNIWMSEKAQMLGEGKKNDLKKNVAFCYALKEAFIREVLNTVGKNDSFEEERH